MTTINNSREISLYLSKSATLIQRNKRRPKAAEDVAENGERRVPRLNYAQSPGASSQNYSYAGAAARSISPGYLLVYNNRGEGITAFSSRATGEYRVDFYV